MTLCAAAVTLWARARASGGPAPQEVLVNKNPALFAFMAVCIVLAVLLLAGVVTTIVASLLFAATLLVFGFASRRTLLKK